MEVVRLVMPMCAASAVLAACSLAADHAEPSHAQQAPSCITATASVSALGVENFLADRRGDNRFALPWRDSTPPRVVTDARVCRQAARAYLRDSRNERADSTLRAVVVQAGGLYFVKALPAQRAGEFELVAIVNDRFQLVKYVTQ